MSTVCMGIEGVLAKASGLPLVQRQVDADALRLYGVLKAGYRVVLLSSHRVESETSVRHWLGTYGVAQYDDLVFAADDSIDGDVTDIRFRQVTMMRASRTDVALFVESDALAVTMAAQQGISSMLWLPARPALMRGDMQPRRIRNWSAIMGEIEDQRTFVESRES